MSKAANEQWEEAISQAERKMREEQSRVQQPRVSNRKLNCCLFVVPLLTLLLGYLFPKQLESLAFAVWLGGGFFAFGALAFYATSKKVSHEVKEAALSFLLGNLVVFGLLMLKPI